MIIFINSTRHSLVSTLKLIQSTLHLANGMETYLLRQLFIKIDGILVYLAIDELKSEDKVEEELL